MKDATAVRENIKGCTCLSTMLRYVVHIKVTNYMPGPKISQQNRLKHYTAGFPSTHPQPQNQDSVMAFSRPELL